MNIDETLRSIGFTGAEAKVYLTLLRLGQSRAGAIIKMAGLQSSVIHNCLNTLQEKGFITAIIVGNIKEYAPLDPRVIESYIDAKKTEYHKILPALNSLRSRRVSDTAEVYQGYQGLLNAMLVMVQDAQQGEVFKYFAAPLPLLSEDALAFFAKADLIRKEKGVRIRGIATMDNKTLEAYHHSEIRFTQQSIPPAMNIFRDSILLMSLEHKPTATLIHSREIARQYHALWDTLWKTAVRK
jgi:HTH-type transcriptional regulator, sugar sensing transcriptional regulator